MTEKQVFTKDNLSDLLRLQADALGRGEVLEFEECKFYYVDLKSNDEFIFRIDDNQWVSSITLKPKPQLRKATAMEWLEWACSDECKGWAVKWSTAPKAPQWFNYIETDAIESFQRAKFDNGKLGEFDYFWVEV